MGPTTCAKCNRPLRYGTEQAGLDANNIPIYKQYGYCDNCMIKYDIPYTNYVVPESKKKHSTLSILSIIFTMITCTCFVGFILAIIDLCQNDKTKKHVCSWISIAICALFFFLLVIGYGVDTATNTTNTTQSTVVSIQPASITQTNNDTDDGIINIESNGCSLKYLRHEMTENALGDKCLAVFYEFTNNSEETTACIYQFSDQAFQNGVELETSFFSIEDIEDNESKEIRPGVSVEVYSLFKTQDTSMVELEVSEWISFSDKPLDSMLLALE